MATKNFVPRGDLEGGLGTDSKRWASGSFGRVQFASHLSGSKESTGSFGRIEATKIVGDGSGLTGLTPAAIATYNTSGDNRIITSVNSSTVQGESGLTYDGLGLNVTGHVTASGNISGSSSSTASFGRYLGDGSQLTGITSGIFQTTASVEATTNDLQVTGSLKVNTTATSSTAIFTNNIQNGYPTSNNWGEGLEGSYFNNFNKFYLNLI